MPGYIKDYRDELNSDIWLMPPLYHRVWQYLKYNVNHSEKKIPMDTGEFFTVKPGQRLTSVRQIAQGVGYYEGLKWKEPNPKTISTILKWMEKQQMITIDRGKGNRQYTLVTLINWDLYQSKKDGGNSKETPNGEGKKQSADINNNDQECKKNDKDNIPFADIVNYLNEKTNKKFRPTTKKTKEVISARWGEGFREDDFYKVIDICCMKWKGQKFGNGAYGDDYLQPSTLFNNKFEERLNWTEKVTDINSRKTQKHADKLAAFDNLTFGE
ncbi:conserved phage C-terminal domain-containing protein [Gracilibacillus thailandensis]|uniref:Phage conserved hypothetical protein C-terminal domain-containing protein n=1 Tax=Gracilibacillus thailandensis TaxID=563735 RepID=A0A6N7QYZ4_9BACI|nr:conserved phage C-terminal domain-containing protein [Gracilibacillus thailandensis]MRI65129.1 hypothetical protein [Gracilibacillus thailandensis]